MSIIKFHKVINNLPSTLEPNAIYAVRVGEGFDLYISDNSGNFAFRVNSSGSVSLPFSFWSFSPKPPGYNDYHVPYAVGGTAGTTLTLTANRIYWIPFLVDRSVSITEIAINVTTAATGTAYVGIYNSNSQFQPNQLIWISSGLDTGTTGVKVATNNLPLTLNPGVYWFGFVCSAAAVIRAIALAASRSLALPSLGTANLNYWYTSGSSLPSTAPTSGYTGATGGAVPAIGVKYSFTP